MKNKKSEQQLEQERIEFLKKYYRKLTLQALISNIKLDLPFSFSRFNDGEMVAIFKSLNMSNRFDQHKMNMDYHQYFYEMGVELYEAWKYKADNYFKQSSPGYTRKTWFKDCMEKIFNENPDNSVWSNDVFHEALRENPMMFRSFINELQNSGNPIILVGPEYLSGLTWLNYKKLINIPQVDCYLAKDSILYRIRKHVTKHGENGKWPCIVLFSASMTTNVLIHNLHQEFGKDHFFIDVGSLWDCFFFHSRKEINQRSPIKREIVKLEAHYSELFIK